MRVMREELRRTLQWCLNQDERFSMVDCKNHFNVHQTAISGKFIVLESLGFLKREFVTSREQYFTIKGRQEAETAANAQPKPRNGYVKKANRPQTMPKRIINSVWSLGA